MMEKNYSRLWNTTLRLVLSRLLNFPLDSILYQGQPSDRVTPDEFISYFLLNEESEDTAYTCDYRYRITYHLTYVISIYGRRPNELARELLKQLRLQGCKDILQPSSMALKSCKLLSSIAEPIGNKVYNRTDVTVTLSALIDEANPNYIDKVNVKFV